MSRNLRRAAEGDIAVVGSATSHALASVRAIRALQPSRRVRAVAFDADASAAAREIDGVIATEELPAPDAVDGVIFATDMAPRFELLASLLDAGVPVFIHKPAVADLDGLHRLQRVLEAAPHLAVTGSILRYADVVRSLDLGDAAEVEVTVEHLLCRRREGEAPPEWGGRVARDFGIHGLDLLDQLGRRPRTCPAVTWDSAACAMTVHVGHAGGTDRVVLSARARGERYRIRAQGQEWSLPAGGVDPLGHEQMHRVFLGMIRGDGPPVPIEDSLALIAATLEAADHAQLAVTS
ncbi:hypothetical protein ACEYYH_05225 [Microbacterium trichothecenolyticum]|uniref:hypothetical protein n=1 Tax=Microbacterium trichothecenolyticum TaxID=69370 RepID=UPI0035BE8504